MKPLPRFWTRKSPTEEQAAYETIRSAVRYTESNWRARYHRYCLTVCLLVAGLIVWLVLALK